MSVCKGKGAHALKNVSNNNMIAEIKDNRIIDIKNKVMNDI